MEAKNLGLGLSGGGYRATLFNLGALIRINELGPIGKLKRITSVSGGSITNGYLAMRWNDLRFNDDGVIERFKENIVDPLWDFCSKSLDAGAIATNSKRCFKMTSTGCLSAMRGRRWHINKNLVKTGTPLQRGHWIL